MLNTAKNFRTFVSNKIFTAKFVKKNGEIRTINARIGVQKGVKNPGGVSNKEDTQNFIRVFDLKKDAWRTLNLDSMFSIKANGILLEDLSKLSSLVGELSTPSTYSATYAEENNINLINIKSPELVSSSSAAIGE